MPLRPAITKQLYSPGPKNLVGAYAKIVYRNRPLFCVTAALVSLFLSLCVFVFVSLCHKRLIMRMALQNYVSKILVF